MMTVETKKLSSSKLEIKVTVPKEIFAQHYQKTINSLKQRVEIPGFRPGFAPANLVIEKIGQAQVDQEVLKDLVPLSFVQAVVKEKISPVKDPEIEIIQLGLGKDLIFKAVVLVLPEVKLGNYQKIKIKKEEAKKITETQIEEALKRVAASSEAQKEESGFIYDAQGNKVTVGATSENKDYEPLAKKIGFKDLSEMKEKIKEELESQENYEAEKKFEEKLFDELIKTAEIEVVPELIEDEVNRLLSNFNYQMQSNGVKLEEYLTHQGKTLESLREEWQPQAERNIRVELILRKIAQEEKVEVTKEEIDSQLHKDHGHKHTPQELQREENFLRNTLRQSKILKSLKEMIQNQ